MSIRWSRVMSVLFAVALSVAVAPTAGAQRAAAPPPLNAATLDLDGLDDWGRRSYRYIRIEPERRRAIGTVALETELSGRKVTMRDAWSIESDGAMLSWRMKADWDRGGLMEPTKVVANGTETDELASYRMQVVAGLATIRDLEGARSEMELPEGVVTDAALLRIVTLLPRERGRRWRIDRLLELSELNLKRGGVLACVGPESVDMHGEPVQLWRFAYRSGDRLAAQFWVDPDGGALRRFMFDTRKLFVEADPTEK